MRVMGLRYRRASPPLAVSTLGGASKFLFRHPLAPCFGYRLRGSTFYQLSPTVPDVTLAFLHLLPVELYSFRESFQLLYLGERRLKPELDKLPRLQPELLAREVREGIPQRPGLSSSLKLEILQQAGEPP